MASNIELESDPDCFQIQGYKAEADNDPMKTILGAAAGGAGAYGMSALMPKR
jgi:hypothetical protein